MTEASSIVSIIQRILCIRINDEVLKANNLAIQMDGASGLIEHKGVSMSGPNFDTGLPSQMSDKWIQYVQDKLRTDGKTSVANMIRDFDNKITKYVTAIDRELGELNFLKLGV